MTKSKKIILKNIVSSEEIEVARSLNLSSLSDIKYSSIFTNRTKEHILLKHLFIYNEHIKIRREMMRIFPEIASFLPKYYFYIVVAHRYSLTPNYVCAIINKTKKKVHSIAQEMEDAKIKVANDECQDYFTRG